MHLRSHVRFGLRRCVLSRFGLSRLLLSTAVGALAAMLATPGLHAQTLPSLAPTSLPQNNALPAPIAATTAPGPQTTSSPHPAKVTFADGKIDIRANNSSLNQILRAVSRATGLKITGGVPDERVFGNYGPAPLSSVIATLLDGTGTNILFLSGDADNAPHLVLTRRGGGATPPSPDSPAYAAYDEQPSPAAQPAAASAPQPEHSATTVPTGPPSSPQPLNNVNGSPSNTSPSASTLPTTHSVPLDSVPTPSTTPSTAGIVDAPNPPPPGSTTSAAPATSLTPEQVYQQLLQRQKQQPSNQPTTNATPQP